MVGPALIGDLELRAADVDGRASASPAKVPVMGEPLLFWMIVNWSPRAGV